MKNDDHDFISGLFLAFVVFELLQLAVFTVVIAIAVNAAGK